MKILDRTYSFVIVIARRLSERQLMILLAIIVGFLAALGTYIFEILVRYIKMGLVSWFPVDGAGYLFLIYPLMGIVLASLFVKYVIKDNISEGVTRVLYAMSKRGSQIRMHNCYSSIAGGAITIGFGGSVGPEAPIVLTGSAIGSNVGRFLRLNYKQLTLLIGCGAAAAISAIFKAPITGVVFVLEILMLDITTSSVMALVISSVTATTLVFFLNGFDPILSVRVGDTFALGNIPLYVVLGVLCGLLSYYFKYLNGRIARYFGSMRSQAGRWLAGGAILGLLIFVFPPLYGEGYEGFTDLMHGNMEALFKNSMFYAYRNVSWFVTLYLLAILFFKVVAMASTNAAGGVGGTFAPSLFVGAFAGGAMAYICNAFLGAELPIVSFTLVGMAGVMSGVMNAPLTSIFLIAELSDGYGLFVPLMLTATIAFAVGYYFDPHSIYTRRLSEQGELLTHNKDKSVLVFLNLNDLMETDFHPIKRSDTLGDVVELISTVRRNIFPVVGSGGFLEGIVQLDDLRADMFSEEKYRLPIENYMMPLPGRILPNEQMESVLKAFEESGAWMLPVVDGRNRYLGFISKSRILARYREQLVKISE